MCYKVHGNNALKELFEIVTQFLVQQNVSMIPIYFPEVFTTRLGTILRDVPSVTACMCVDVRASPLPPSPQICLFDDNSTQTPSPAAKKKKK